MGFVVIAVILGIISLGGFGALMFADDPDARGFGGFVGVVGLVFSIGAILIGSMTTVSANHVAVVTKFGAYQGQLPSGFQWKSPLESTEEIPTRTILVTLDDVPVRFQGNSGGWADLVVGWHADKGVNAEANIRKLWETYRTREEIESKLVTKVSANGVNQTLAAFEPGAGISGASLPEVNAQTLESIRTTLGGSGVVIDAVTVSQVRPDEESQNRINKQVAALADQQTAKTERDTAAIQRDTAGIRNQTQSQTSLAYECLLTAKNWDQNRQGPMPLVWNCLQGADTGNLNLNAPANR